MNKLNESITYINSKTKIKPALGIILGSGLGVFADMLDSKVKISSSNIPHYPKSTVEGHAGNFVFGKWKNSPILAIQGRTHYYEGYSIEKVTYVVRIMAAMGVKALIVTNASGGINPNYLPGDLMLITDHINGMFRNPLIGPLKYGGERFPDMSNPYASEYFEMIEKIAKDKNITLHKGTLYTSTGPTYETAAEVRMIRDLGGDIASMSTVPEVIVANHAGLKVIGISCITNLATGIGSEPLSHAEVTETADKVREKFIQLVSGIVEQISTQL